VDVSRGGARLVLALRRGLELDQTLELGFVLAAMGGALARATPEICNSDQGSHFTSPQYLELLTGAAVRISMDGKGRALDNVFTERLWRSVKYEEVYLRDYASPKEARRGLERYFAYYNQERPHQALGYRTPAAMYAVKRPATEAASDDERSEQRKEASLP
jgi:putative transposase